MNISTLIFEQKVLLRLIVYSSFMYGGLGVSKCRSPPFFVLNFKIYDKKEGFEMSNKKKYYLFANSEKVEVDELVYREYYKLLNHEKYLRRKDADNRLLLFSSLVKNDYSFAENLSDEKVDIEKMVETSILLDRLNLAMGQLDDREREIIKRIFFGNERLSDIARTKNISYQAIQYRKRVALNKLRRFIENEK